MIKVEIDSRELNAYNAKNITRAMERALKKAGSTGLRDMRSEANKRVRRRKRIRAKFVRNALVLRFPGRVELDGTEWAIDVGGGMTPLSAYPVRQTKQGVSVEINTGQRTLVKGAFIATMKSGHRGVWMRFGSARLPIRELIASRPVDALLHKGEAEAVQERGAQSMSATFTRLLPMELAKDAAKSRQRATWAK